MSTAEKARNALLGSLAGVVVVIGVALLTGDEADEAAGSSETTTTASVEPPEETTTTETVESPEEFAERLASAIRDGDATFLFDRLAEETLERYGADQCETYTTGLHDEQFALELREVAAKQDWVYETDGVSTTVDDVTALELERTDSRGETIIQEIHLARRGTVFHWFTDCGVPEG
ncbi:MAG: hypothetical protein U5K29_13075 [Acidimicrobiales bacterium]|nr:hypothetical protein [Acidimicrobiales bacterium]